MLREVDRHGATQPVMVDGSPKISVFGSSFGKGVVSQTYLDREPFRFSKIELSLLSLVFFVEKTTLFDIFLFEKFISLICGHVVSFLPSLRIMIGFDE